MSEYIVKCNEIVGISGKTLIFPDYIDMNQEIVRCKDCKHVSRDEGKTWRECYRLGAYREFYVEPDDFCSWGERRDNHA